MIIENNSYNFTTTVEQAFVDGLDDFHEYYYHGHESFIREINVQPANEQGFVLYDVTLYDDTTFVTAGGDVLRVEY